MNFEELSKKISYALRHAPWEYELELDSEGWVSLEQLIESLARNPKWKNLCSNDVENMIANSIKKRHEISGDRIKAFYGHSIPMKIEKEERKPPHILYHGTKRKSEKTILTQGLRPCSRQYVHLSQDVETAMEVGKRRDIEPIILIIEAEKAYTNGVKFYYGNEKVWLADTIPPQFIRSEKN